MMTIRSALQEYYSRVMSKIRVGRDKKQKVYPGGQSDDSNEK